MIKGSNGGTERKKGHMKEMKFHALATVALWIECWLVNQRVTGSIPSQGTCLGCGPGSQWGVCERQPLSTSLSPSFPLSKNSK